MESTLLSVSRFIPSQNKEVGRLVGKFHSSFYGKMICTQSCVMKTNTISSGSRNSLVISSVYIKYIKFVFWPLGKKTKKKTLVPEPDYRIPIVLLGWAGGLASADNLFAAAPVGLLGTWIAPTCPGIAPVGLLGLLSGLNGPLTASLISFLQTTRVRFVFDEEALEVKIGEQLEVSGENVFVGGKNRWKYSTFVNWELWWPNFPILVYFKETQTKPEGQVHFFPVIFNGKQLYDVMVERCGPSQTSTPKEP